MSPCRCATYMLLTVKHTVISIPKGPNGEKRPADAISLAVTLARIATVEFDDSPEDDGMDPAAKAQGRKGGAARAASMTPERRAEIAKLASAKRWGRTS